MPDETRRLKLLRGWFVVYCLFQSVVGTVVAASVLESLSASTIPMMRALRGFSPRSVIVSSVGGSLVIFALALVLFSVYMIRTLQYDKEIRLEFLPADQK
jgi:hypothetical protein